MSSVPINIGDVFLIDTPPNGQHFYIAIAKTSFICEISLSYYN